MTVVLGALLASACGRTTTIYADPNNTGVVGVPYGYVLPDGFTDQSVNNAKVEVLPAAQPSVLKFSLLDGTKMAGAFNDAAATGNRALLSIGKYDHSALANFSLTLNSASDTNVGASVSLLVDLNCDGSTPVRTLISDGLPNGVSSASISDVIWSVAGAAMTDASSNILVPSQSSLSSSDLKKLLVSYPHACLRNAVSDADDAPKNISLGSVLLSIGGGSSTSVESLTVSDLLIKGDDIKTWGQQ